MIRIDDKYTEFRDDTDPNYPGGKAVNAPTPESIEGTPFLAEWMNCTGGFRQAVFLKAYGSINGVSGKPDNANDSDTLDAIEKLINNGDADTLASAINHIDELRGSIMDDVLLSRLFMEHARRVGGRFEVGTGNFTPGFDFAGYFQTIPLGNIDSLAWPLQMASIGPEDALFEMLQEGEGRAIRVTAVQDWVGVDVLRRSGVTFAAGDRVRVRVFCEQDNQILLNSDNGGWRPLGGAFSVQANTFATIIHILTQADVDAISSNSPEPGFRIRGNRANASFRITEIDVGQPEYQTLPGGVRALVQWAREAFASVIAPSNGTNPVRLRRNVGGDVDLPNAVGGTDAARRAGMMTGEDKQKLDGIADGAQVNPGEATAAALGLVRFSNRAGNATANSDRAMLYREGGNTTGTVNLNNFREPGFFSFRGITTASNFPLLDGLTAASWQGTGVANSSMLAVYRTNANSADGCVQVIYRRDGRRYSRSTASTTAWNPWVAEPTERVSNIPATGGDNAVPTVAATRSAIARESQFTFIVDSDDALAAWADNAPGNDYSRVLIKAGTWTLSRDLANGTEANPRAFIDISNGRTLSVTGEAGGRIELVHPRTSAAHTTGILGNVRRRWNTLDTPGPGYFFQNVEIITRISGQGNSCFRDCFHLFSCTGLLETSGTGVDCAGFMNCSNLSDCVGASSGQGSTHNSGFRGCSALSACSGTATGSNGSGFRECSDLCRCFGTAAGAMSNTGFRECSNLHGCFGTATAVFTAASQGFWNCLNLFSCTGYGENGANGIGFRSCSNLFGCTGIGSHYTGTPLSGRGRGFDDCFYLVNCTGTGIGVPSSTWGSHGFQDCRTGFGNRNGSSPSSHGTFQNCFMEQGEGSTPWANTSAGGWNDPGITGAMLVLQEAEGLLASALQPYTSPLAMARAAVDPEFDALRVEVFMKVTAVTKQPGYPHDVDWTGMVGLIDTARLATFHERFIDSPDRRWVMPDEVVQFSSSRRILDGALEDDKRTLDHRDGEDALIENCEMGDE